MGQATGQVEGRRNLGRAGFPSKTVPNRRPASAPSSSSGGRDCDRGRSRSPGDAPPFSEKCDPRPRRGPLTEDQRALAARYLPLAAAMAAAMARRVGCRALDRDELESSAFLALVEAAGRFDPARTVDFATFARHRVRGALLDYKREWIARVFGRAAGDGPGGTADGDGETTKNLRLGASALAPQSLSTGSLDILAGSVIGRPVAPEVGAELERAELVEQCLRQLPDAQASACRLMYVDGKSQDEAAAVLGFSKSYLSRLHKNAIERLARDGGCPAANGAERAPHAA